MKKLPFFAGVCAFQLFTLCVLGAPHVEVLATFEDQGSSPVGPWVEMEDGSFIGSLSVGGVHGYGTLLRIEFDGTVTPLLQPTKAIGKIESRLTRGSDGFAYGTTRLGGASLQGLCFRISPAGQFEKLADFRFDTARQPAGALLELAPGEFYGAGELGVPTAGGTQGGGIYRIGATRTITHVYTFPDAFSVSPKLHFARGGFLYGTTRYGGTTHFGTFFRVAPDGTFTHLASAADFGGAYPVDFMDGGDGFFYCTIQSGGADTRGTLFRMTPDGGVALLPDSSDVRLLARDSSGRIYGSANRLAVANVYGPALFRINPGADPANALTIWQLPFAARALQVSADGTIYGVGSNQFFRFEPESGFTLLHTFTSSEGISPTLLHTAHDGRFYGTTIGGAGAGYGSVVRLDAQGQCEKLRDFGPAQGSKPAAGLVQDSVGNLYGITKYASPSNMPSRLFRIAPDGAHNNLPIPFSSGRGNLYTSAGLTRWSDGSFWGHEGDYSRSSLFRFGAVQDAWVVETMPPSAVAEPSRRIFDPGDGRLYVSLSSYPTQGAKLFRFAPNDFKATALQARLASDNLSGGIALSVATLVRGADGTLYGRTASSSEAAIFKLTESTTFDRRPIMSLLTTVNNGSSTATTNSALALGADGHLYGVSPAGGTYGPRIYQCRTEATLPAGTARLTTAASFPSGADVRGGLVALPDGKLYGAYNRGFVGPVVIYRFTPGGQVETLYTEQLRHPFYHRAQTGELTLGSDGALYGVTAVPSGWSSPSFFGSIFRFDPTTRAFTTLHMFSGTDGTSPSPELSQGLDGNLYGVTTEGGPGGNGVVFGIFIKETRPPVASGLQATDIGLDRATVSAAINTRSLDTRVSFRYHRERGLTEYAETPAQLANGRATATLTGLARGATYYFAAVATNANGTTKSTIASFTTRPNSPPVAAPDLVGTRDRRAVTFAPLANDRDPDGDPLHLVSVGAPAHGTVTVAGNRIIYQPGPSFSGRDAFTYVAEDRFANGTVTGTVTIFDPFRASHGSFAGFLQDGESIAGFLRLSGSGTFSATLQLGAKPLAFRGRIGLDNTFTATLPGGRTIALQLQPDGTLAGTLLDGERTLTFAASVPDHATAASAGAYTVVLRPQDAALPAGIGIGHLDVKPTGHARFAGWLGDGTPFSASAAVDGTGALPLFLTVDRTGGGFLAASIAFADLANSDCQADFTWTRAANASREFPAGFQGAGRLEGSRFVPPAALHYSDPAHPSATLSLSGMDALEITLEASATGWAGGDATCQARLELSPQQGLIRGTFRDSAQPTSRRSLRGILLQKQNTAAGHVTGGTEPGAFTLSPH